MLWAAPIVALLAVYWYGLRAWYQMDDFAWLNLHTFIHDIPSFLAAMFKPLAQGTVRPLSERLYFLVGWLAGGMEAAWLLRGIAFLTQSANLILVVAITRRLTGGSLLAGSAAAVLWACHANAFVPMGWSSAYNQILCGFFLLSALWLWIRYTDTEDPQLYWAQFGVFVLGFGALEINVVYPALALLFALCFDRRKFAPQTAPMFGLSALYAVVHGLMAAWSNTRNETYRLYFDAGIFGTLWSYLKLAFGAQKYAHYKKWPVMPFLTAEVVVGLALLAFVVWMLTRRQWMAAFGVGWYLAVLAPVLPLKMHIANYYLFLPMIGLAMIAGWGLALAWERAGVARIAAVVLCLAYLLPSAVMARGMTIQYFLQSRRGRTFVRSLAYVHQVHPAKTVVVRHIDDELFWAAWYDNPFQLFGMKKVFIAGEDQGQIGGVRSEPILPRFFLSEREQLAGLQAGDLVVYELMPGGHLRNVSELRREVLARETSLAAPAYLTIGQAEAAPFLKSGWWEPEGNFRWTAGHAEFTIHGPSTPEGELVIRGMCPEQHMAKGPLHLAVSVDGERLAPLTVSRENLTFEFRQKLPSRLAGKPSVTVTVDVDRVLQIPGDRRELGVAMASAEVLR